jgi:outer membrane protein assembly factor BamA
MFYFIYTKHTKLFRIIANLAVILIITALQSCSATKYVLKDDESLLIANNIVLKTDIKNIDDKSEIQSGLAKQVVYNQQPNKKFLGFFRLKLGLYASSYRKKQKKNKAADANSKSFMEDYAGEPPVLFDSTAIEASMERMKNYLFYKGYFHGKVEASYITKNKKTTVNYYAATDTAYRFRNIYRQTEDSLLKPLIHINENETFLKPGDVFDIDKVAQERERLATIIQDKGYYTFSPDFIILRIDSTTAGAHLIDAYLVVKNELDSSLHKKYIYLDVNLNISHDAGSQLKKTDYIKRDLDTICHVNYNVANNTVAPRILARSLRLKPEDIYSVKEQVATQNNLYSLGVFKFVNIKHEPFSFSPEEMGLITSIECVPNKRHSFSNELELNTNAQSSLGFSLAASYINKNVFNTAAKLSVSVRSGVDFQLQKRFQDGERLSAINNVNVVAEAKITLARIFPAFKGKECNTYEKYKPKTNISVSYNFQRRIQQYTLNAININYGYEWYHDKFRHIFSPLSMTYVSPTGITDSFQRRLDDNSFLKRSFSPQFILGQDYTFFYTNQNINVGKYKNNFSLRTNVNIAGTILYAFASLSKDKTKPYNLAKIPFAQFARFEAEPKYFFNFRRGQSLGFRTFVGIGIPYGNSVVGDTAVMPYIKQFSGGGPTSLRAWPFRQVGPGGYKFRTTNTNVSQLDQTGDIRLELNAEYRFNIFSIFKGAVFTDAGNVWMYQKNPKTPDGEFNIKRFGKEIAWCAGLGIRMDLSFFVIRFDVALPLYDPSYTADVSWVNDIVAYRKSYMEQKYIENPTMTHKEVRKQVRRTEIGRMIGYNIAIGYPF